MRIGVDIDNVISNFEELLVKEYLKHDKTLRNTGIIDKTKWVRDGTFDWTHEEEQEFYKSNIEKFAINLNPIEGSVEYIDKLMQDGNEIYIISGRDNGEYKNPYEMTKEWLEKHKIKYTKLILTDAYDSHAKSIACKNNNIDIMIDDSPSICCDLKRSGINVLMMKRKYYKQKNSDIEIVRSWKEIYEKISGRRVNVILDTDTYNECDDQFALAYMIKSQDIFNIEAITIAPFQNDRDVENDSGINRSYTEAKKVLELCGENSENKIFKGSTNYISKGYDSRNEAVNKIIEISLKNDKTYILGIAAITNIALAIKYEPKIIDKIEIIWLGGHTLLKENNLYEANFKDIAATKIVFESNVKLTIIPCKGVASELQTTVYELENIIKGKHQLGDFLYNTFKDYLISKGRNRWPLWDVSVIAYMINKNWFETFETNCPDINEDTSYRINKANRLITFVGYLNANEIYKDLFKKLGESND